MKNSKFVIDKLAKLFEQGLISSKDIAAEIMAILKSKRDEIVFKMKLTSIIFEGFRENSSIINGKK